MDEKIDEAIEFLASKCSEKNVSAPDAINFSQAALNLANCKKRMSSDP